MYCFVLRLESKGQGSAKVQGIRAQSQLDQSSSPTKKSLPLTFKLIFKLKNTLNRTLELMSEIMTHHSHKVIAHILTKKS